MKKISMVFLFISICINSNAQEISKERNNSSNQTVKKTSVSEEINGREKSSTQTLKEPAASEGVRVEKSINKSTTLSIRAGENQVTHDEAYFLNEISKIDNQISAINQKISIVNSNPVEAENATNSGWFDDMDKIKSELMLKKADIQNHLN